MTTVFDYKADLLQDTVATAPSPALSGTTITPTTPSLFPDPASVGAYDVYYIASLGIAGSRSSVEKLRFTAKSGSQYTITRAQGVTTAKPIAIGGILYIAPTSKHFTDLETAVNTLETNQTEIEVDIVDLESSVTYLNQLVFNVKSYGAIGDGVANDYTAIQAAITAAMAIGGTVYFPPGTYKTSTGLVVPNTRSITIRGASWASVLTGTASVLLTITGGTDTSVRTVMRDMMVLVPGAQTGVSYSGTWSAAGNSSLAFDNCYIHGTSTATQILVKYTGMANTTFIQNTVITNNDVGNDCTAILCDGATSSVMGLRIIDSTIIAKRAINLNSSGPAPNDVEGIWIHHCEISGVTYGVRVGPSLAIGIDHCEFTAGGCSVLLTGANAHTVIDSNYMDVGGGLTGIVMIDIQTNAISATLDTKITNNHLTGWATTTGIKVDTSNAGFYNATITGNDLTGMATCMDFSTGVLAGEFAINIISHNPLRDATAGIAMGTSSSKRTGNIISDNPVGVDVTTFYTGQRIGNTVINNSNDPDQTWTPTITAGNAGAITAVSALGHYHQSSPNKWWFQVVITMTTNGAGASYLICPLPTGLVGAAFVQVMAGVRSDSQMLWGSLSSGASAINIQLYSGLYPGLNGTTITLTGELEMA